MTYFKNLKAALFILAQITAVLAAKSQTTISTLPVDGWYKIQVAQSGKYLSIENAGNENGARLVQWDYAGGNNQKFMLKKNEDGSYSFIAAHSNKSVCANRGDNKEGDVIIQNENALSQFFGKWQLQFSKQDGCKQGWKIMYGNSGIPVQLIGDGNGASFQLKEPQHHDGGYDCTYTYIFEPAETPRLKETIKTELRQKPGTMKKSNR